MDLNMPIMDGFVATQRILSYQQAEIDKKMRGAMELENGVNDAPPAVIAAVTAYVNDDIISQCFQ